MSYFDPKLSDYFLYEGKLVRALWENRGDRTIGFKFIEQKDFPKCPSCGCPLSEHNGIELIIDCPLFQENAKPLELSYLSKNK